MRVFLSHDPADLYSLQEEWSQLQDNSATDSVFMTWEWIGTWWEHFGKTVELWLLWARDDSDILVALAPLMVRNHRPMMKIRWLQLEFIGAPAKGDHLDFIIQRGMEEQIIPLFMNEIRKHQSRWDMLNLTIPEYSPNLLLLKEYDVRWVYDEPNICPFVPLPGDWESFSKSLSHKKRKRQRSYFRKLNEEYPDQWEWRMVTSDSQIDETLTELVDLHQALWKSLGRLGSFHHPAIVSFHKTVAAQFLKSNYLRIYRLEIAGELAAVSLHYMFRGKAFYFSSGRRQDLAHLHIGHVLQEIAIRDALLSDAHEYDFLRGDEQYKLAWGAILRQDLTLLWPTTTRVRMEQWVISVIAVVWRQLKPAIPDRLQQLMKQRLRTNSVSQLMNG